MTLTEIGKMTDKQAPPGMTAEQALHIALTTPLPGKKRPAKTRSRMKK